jgi:hypothetical protein
MLKLRIAAVEKYDEEKKEFIYSKEHTLQLEHSLVSLSKWESRWHKPFLTKENKTREESIDYIRCMTLTQNVDPEAYDNITEENLREVHEYIAASLTATTFSDENKPPNRDIITSELIYCWMVSANIPFECQKWHLSRLFTLIRVCNVKGQPPKKRSGREIMSRNTALNAARRQKYNTKG